MKFVRYSPPRLHWAAVLVFSLITLGFFGMAWMIVQAKWMRRVRGRSAAFPLAVVHCASLPLLSFILLGAKAAGAAPDAWVMTATPNIFRYAIFVLWFATVFVMREELTGSPFNLTLGNIMTFLFGPVYFQYHLCAFEFARPEIRRADVLEMPGMGK